MLNFDEIYARVRDLPIIDWHNHGKVRLMDNACLLSGLFGFSALLHLCAKWQIGAVFLRPVRLHLNAKWQIGAISVARLKV